MLLDIAEAAALLRVSEASLRRWTNRGLLPCLRIGGRRERRFRRADLMAFVEGQSATPTGHICGLYTSDRARTRQAARLLGDGLDAGSVCFFAGQPDVHEPVLAQLARRRRSLRNALDGQRLILTRYADSAAQQLAFWKAKFEAATRDGARSIRVVGDVSGAALARGDGFARVLEYEAAYGRLSGRFPVNTQCLYDARVHSGLETAGVLAAHPDLFRQPVAHLVS
ncbi:MAG TPA: MEDS domain-containing protein [Gemmatimonadales bacterium]|nr:MEDS domain-containing protein [Gemmatimonadales bacterium]